MKFEAMFQPIQIGPMTVANRFVMSPMGNNFANTDGTMSERSAFPKAPSAARWASCICCPASSRASPQCTR